MNRSLKRKEDSRRENRKILPIEASRVCCLFVGFRDGVDIRPSEEVGAVDDLKAIPPPLLTGLPVLPTPPGDENLTLAGDRPRPGSAEPVPLAVEASASWTASKVSRCCCLGLRPRFREPIVRGGEDGMAVVDEVSVGVGGFVLCWVVQVSV